MCSTSKHQILRNSLFIANDFKVIYLNDSLFCSQKNMVLKHAIKTVTVIKAFFNVILHEQWKLEGGGLTMYSDFGCQLYTFWMSSHQSPRLLCFIFGCTIFISFPSFIPDIVQGKEYCVQALKNSWNYAFICQHLKAFSCKCFLVCL